MRWNNGSSDSSRCWIHLTNSQSDNPRKREGGYCNLKEECEEGSEETLKSVSQKSKKRLVVNRDLTHNRGCSHMCRACKDVLRCIKSSNHPLTSLELHCTWRSPCSSSWSLIHSDQLLHPVPVSSTPSSLALLPHYQLIYFSNGKLHTHHCAWMGTIWPHLPAHSVSRVQRKGGSTLKWVSTEWMGWRKMEWSICVWKTG